jgi:Sulfotransferase domain
LPVFRLNRAFSVGRDVKAFLNMQGGLTRGMVPDCEDQAERLRKIVTRQRKALQRKDRQIEEQAARLENVRGRRHRERRLKAELKQQRIDNFQLRNKLDTMNGLVESTGDVPSRWGEPKVGSLPDFVIIGAQKGGTSFLYHLLTRHPLVEPAARKELHFFDGPENFRKGAEWYRRCFPRPKWNDGQRSITGEATPYYLFDPRVPERMAEMVPQARLIALLRNPIDRAYSHYQMQVKRSTEPRTFEEAIEQQDSSYLSKGIYLDQLLRWFAFFSSEQLLILKSEDFFQRPVETLNVVLDFLDLPEWQPETSELQERRHQGGYGQKMDPSTRRRLEAYFEPYNQRLYEYLGVDFGW